MVLSSLTSRGYRVEHRRDADGLHDPDILDRARVIVLTAAGLARLPPHLTQDRSARGRHPALVVLADSEGLTDHLAALRAGAAAFFPPHWQPAAMVERLARLLVGDDGNREYRVLVVDDDPAQAHFAASILEKSGVEACVTTDALRIIDEIRTCRPDLILMDIYMPGASGIELTTILREQKDLMDIPIIYLSGEQDPDKQLAALDAGGEDFLTKPIRPKHLVSIVRNRIRRAHALRRRLHEEKEASGDPAQARRHIRQRLDQLRLSPDTGHVNAVLYIEIDSPILLLERIKLDGIDEVVQEMLGRVSDVLEHGDQCFRYGDFCLLLVLRRDDQEALVGIAGLLKDRLDEWTFHAAGREVRLSVSIGVRSLIQGDDDATALINDAVQAAHEARDEHATGIRVAHRRQPETAEITDADSALLERVMDPENLQLVYQPVMPLKRELPPLYQSLLRLRDEQGGLLPAASFLTAVEQSTKILKLDRWVLLKALLTLKRAQRDSDRRLRLLVSQSPASRQDRKRIPWILDNLRKLGLSPEQVVLEYRFPEIVFDLDEARAYFAEIKQAGLGVSLNAIRELQALRQSLAMLEMDYIKFGEALLRKEQSLWESCIDVAHDRHIAVIVSRVEHPDMLGQLWARGIEYIQGNFIQVPQPVLDFDFSGTVLE